MFMTHSAARSSPPFGVHSSFSFTSAQHENNNSNNSQQSSLELVHISSLAPPPETTMTDTPSEHATDLKSGPFSVLFNAVKGNTQILVNVRNNHKLLGRVKAYDRHMNL
jgi:hypothetical protein